VILEAMITCPRAASRSRTKRPMPPIFLRLHGLWHLLRPKSGDCCVFCSYGSVPCPPIQAGETPTCRPSVGKIPIFA